MKARNIKKAQKYSEKVFNRLTTEFLNFLPTASDHQIQGKLMELNDKWLTHCSHTPEMLPEGKEEFLRRAGEMMNDLKLLSGKSTPGEILLLP